MPRQRMKVILTSSQRKEVQERIDDCTEAKLIRRRAAMLLDCDEAVGGPCDSDEEVAVKYGVHIATVQRLRWQYVKDGLEKTLSHHKRHKSTEKSDNYLIERCRSPVPHDRRPLLGGLIFWSAQELANELMAKGYVDYISAESVRKRLIKHELRPNVAPDRYTGNRSWRREHPEFYS